MLGLKFKVTFYVIVMFKRAVTKHTASIIEAAGCLKLKQEAMTPLIWNGPKELCSSVGTGGDKVSELERDKKNTARQKKNI